MNDTTNSLYPGKSEFLAKAPLWLLALVMTIGVGLRLWLAASTDFSIGDSFIGYRFAEQFAAGNGLVFNAGENVGGNTSILYSLLLGLGASTGIDIPWLARSIGIISDMLTFFLLWDILRGNHGVRSPWLQVGVPSLVFLCPILFFYSVCGMETPFYIFTLVFLLHRTLRGVDGYWHLAMAMVLFTRPDGLLAVIVALSAITLQSRKIPWAPLLSTFFVGLAYLGYNHFICGSVIPLTVKVKAEVFNNSVAQNFEYIAGRFFLHRSWLFAAYLAIMASLMAVFRTKLIVVLFGMCAIVYLLFVLFAPYVRTWYAVPFLTLSVCTILFALSKLAEDHRPGRMKPILLGIFSIYFLGSCYAYRKVFIECGVWRERIRDQQELAGTWLRNNTPDDAKIFVTALETGYFAKRLTWDHPGLVSPKTFEIIKSHRGQDIELLEIADQLEVDYAVIPMVFQMTPHPNFLRIRDFGTTAAAAHMGLDATSYTLFQRVVVDQ
jgi:hypothetical protein